MRVFTTILAVVFALAPLAASAQATAPATTPVPSPATGQAAGQAGADPLSTVLQMDSVVTGFTRTTGGRMFAALSRIDGSSGPQLVEWVDGKATPYPDAGWNGWRAGGDAAAAFVHVNAVRVGPDGLLWVVDIGAPGLGNPKVEHGPKILKIDPAANRVVKTYPLDSVTKTASVVDDIRFHGTLAYVTDAGSPAIIILDLDTGAARRVLDGDPTMTAQRPISADDRVLRGPDGKPVKIHADQLEVSPDGRFFFYQPASGPLSRIATRYLDDPKLTNSELTKHITTFSRTGATGGTAIDADGTIYCSDTNRHRIVAIDRDGHQKVLLQDPRLLWVNAMWIDATGDLYLPAAQLDRMAPFNAGVSRLQLPVSIYKMRIGGRPPPSDHP